MEEKEYGFVMGELDSLKRAIRWADNSKDYLNYCEAYRLFSELKEQFDNSGIDWTELLKTLIHCGTMLYIVSRVVEFEKTDAITSTIYPPLLKWLFRTGGY